MDLLACMCYTLSEHPRKDTIPQNFCVHHRYLTEKGVVHYGYEKHSELHKPEGNSQLTLLTMEESYEYDYLKEN